MDISLFRQLTAEAEKIMKRSNDPVHDLSHVRRVVAHTERLCDDMNIHEDQRNALILASWWHDASRTLTKNPSVIWMPLIDDMLSALMLWRATVRARFFGKVPGLACRLILCKSFGTGALFSKFLVSKANRVLIDIIDDADNLDVLNQERVGHLMMMVENSWMYKNSYKIVFTWLLRTSQIHMKTNAAKEYFIDILKRFITFLKDARTYAWHVAQFGKTWTNKCIKKAELALEEFILARSPTLV